jgi:hypothetical protein
MTRASAREARCPRATRNGGRPRTPVPGALGGGLALGFLLRAAAFLISDAAGAATPRDYNVFVAASVSENPPAIVLSWPAEAKATGYQISRKLRTENTWSAEVILARTATSWTDAHVVVGTKYEYRVRRTSTIASAASAALTSYGYLCAGIRVSPTDHRGTVVLVVDETMALPLESELSRLEDDLIGDGWTVCRHDVARSAAVTSVKALIRADHEAAPGEVRAVFLLGHVPVARSGEIAAGGHPDVHRGAFPADLYYGEMDGLWTDVSVNNRTASSSLADCWNVPGDGRFDASYVPGATADFLPGGAVELEVGRVDLWGMTAFLPLTETELLRRYLDKDHAHRHAQRVLPRRALITDNVGEFDGKAYAQGGWRSWGSLFGSANVNPGLFATLRTNAHFGHYMNGAGDNDWCAPTRTTDFAQLDPQVAFVMMYGSHFSDWNKANNILRAPLCTTAGLASVYSGIPHWFLHTLSMGGTFGEAARLVQNNFYTAGAPDWPLPYQPASSFVGGIHLSLHGDPTLRWLAVTPPTALAHSSNSEGHPVLNWAASADASLGYHVYRAHQRGGPFLRLTPEPTTQTTYRDSSAQPGTQFYQVKAVRLEVTPGGTFVNTSQAVTGNFVVGEPTRPSLAIRFDNGRWRLTWPASAVGYALQEASGWMDPDAWTSVAGEPGQEGDRRVWTVPPTGSTRYFRLSRP